MFNLTKIFQQVGQIKVKSITDSLFRYGLLILCLATLASFFKPERWVLIVLFIIGGLFMAIGLFFYCFFAKRNPDFLRSETFQLKKQSMELLGDKSNIANPNVGKVVLLTTSPYSDNGGDENDVRDIPVK